jgi:RNA recognition motif-containing protein
MPWIILDGLPLSFTDEDLRRICAPFGIVVQGHLVRMPDGTPIGFGRVEMGSMETAEAARQALDGRPLNHHTITVRHLRLEEEPPSGSAPS